MLTSRVLMIRPARFFGNPETMSTNFFQRLLQSESRLDVAHRAHEEFENFVNILRTEGVEVEVFDDPGAPETPDSIFPNNWVSFHAGSFVLYPMLAKNRRSERRPEFIRRFEKAWGARTKIDLSSLEEKNQNLEGTGSLVLVRDQQMAFASLSSRTHPQALKSFSEQLNYEVISFEARDRYGKEIYHTNVLLSIGDRFAPICLEAVAAKDQDRLVQSLKQIGREVIPLSFDQLEAFAGNMLQLETKSKEQIWVLSKRAMSSLTPDQIRILSEDSRLVSVPLETIEDHGGGSARCMLAEIF